MPKQTKPDVEAGTPQKKGKMMEMSGKVRRESRELASSPAKTEPLSPMSHNVNVQTREVRPRGLFGMTRTKTACLCFLYLVLIGGLVYFILEWLEVPGLYSQVDRLEGEVDKLAAENAKFAQLNEDLKDNVDDLNIVNEELGATADQLSILQVDLESTLSNLTDQVGQLGELNLNLTSNVDFLNTTAGELADSLEEITEFLADQIESSNILVLANMENAMIQRFLNWDCTFGTVFGAEPWSADFGTEIPASSWVTVKEYVNENVLEELCLDEADFLEYLTNTHELWSTNNLITAVTVYTQAAMDYYFPDLDDDAGLTYADWSNAEFKCENLARKFSYSTDAAV